MTSDRKHDMGHAHRRGSRRGEAARLQQMLLLLPVHVFVFDARLVCRFAAPFGPSFLGRTVDQLVSTPALEIFSRVAAVVPRLLQVLQSGSTWMHPALSYPADPAGHWPAGAWKVHLQPWPDGLQELADTEHSAPESSAAENQPAAAGVLVCCQPVEPQADAGVAPEEAWQTEGRRTAQLLERIRTKLTVIRGHVELLARRETRSGERQALALVRVTAAVDDAERLLREYEQASRLTTRHPDLP